jgi:hypothetical protein
MITRKFGLHFYSNATNLLIQSLVSSDLCCLILKKMFDRSTTCFPIGKVAKLGKIFRLHAKTGSSTSHILESKPLPWATALGVEKPHQYVITGAYHAAGHQASLN